MEPQYETRIKALERRTLAEEEASVLVTADSIPFEETRHGRTRYFLSPQATPPAVQSPWVVFEHDIRHHGGRHRHQGGLIIYVLEGQGVTEVDDTYYAWDEGDVVLLPIQPGGAAHQHFNRAEGTPCRFLAFRFEPFDDHAGLRITQLETTTTARAHWPNDVAEPHLGDPLPTPPMPFFAVSRPEELSSVDLYEWTLAMRDWQRAKRAAATFVIPGQRLPWQLCPLGEIQWYMHPAIAYTVTYNFVFYRQRIAPGERGAKVRHPGEQVTRVLSGRGSTEVNGRRLTWRAGDLIRLPIWQNGVEYQHFNEGDEEVRLLICEPSLWATMDLDRHASFEVLEPASSFGSDHRR